MKPLEAGDGVPYDLIVEDDGVTFFGAEERVTDSAGKHKHFARRRLSISDLARAAPATLRLVESLLSILRCSLTFAQDERILVLDGDSLVARFARSPFPSKSTGTMVSADELGSEWRVRGGDEFCAGDSEVGLWWPATAGASSRATSRCAARAAMARRSCRAPGSRTSWP